MAAKLKLWISRGACSLLPHIVLREAGIDFELVIVDVLKKGFEEEHKRINPKGRIPMLEFEDGSFLTETTAIVTYAAQLSPEKKLLGQNILEVARTYEWLNWLSGTVHERGLGATFKPSSYSDDEKAHDSIRKKCMEFLLDCFRLIEEKLQGIHAVGEDFTAVDVFLYVIYRWGYLMGLDMPTAYPKWTKLVDEVVKRKSVTEAAEKEGIPLIKDNRVPPAGVNTTTKSD